MNDALESDEHRIVYRDIGWFDSDQCEQTDEIPVCGRCVPKNAYFSSREDVPEGPCAWLRSGAHE